MVTSSGSMSPRLTTPVPIGAHQGESRHPSAARLSTPDPKADSPRGDFDEPPPSPRATGNRALAA